MYTYVSMSKCYSIYPKNNQKHIISNTVKITKWIKIRISKTIKIYKYVKYIK